MSNVPAGWYPDHTDPALQRYWDGARWTEHTAPAAGMPAPASAPATETLPSPTGQPLSGEAAPLSHTAGQPTAAPGPGAPRAKRRWIPIVIIAGAVILLLFFAAVAFAVVTLIGRGAPDFTGEDIQRLSISADETPTGFDVPTDDQATDGTVADQLSSDLDYFDSNAGSPAECRDLSFYQPYKATDDADSTDPLHLVGSYVNGDAIIESHARAFGSPADASAQLANTREVIEGCAAGYGTDFFQADSVDPLTVDVPGGVTAVGWSEVGTAGSTTYFFETVDMQRGNIAIRSSCYLADADDDADGVCALWFDTVGTKLAQLTSAG